MKELKATQTTDLKKKRQLLKSEVERHRRERMNRSLESLRALLQKGQHQPGLASGRVEKAEILEHTVLFLRNTKSMVPHERAEQQHFLDGFLACLKQTAQFLKVKGEGQEMVRALTNMLSFCCSRPFTSDAMTSLPACPPGTQSKEPPVQAWQHSWKSRRQLCTGMRNQRFPHHRAPLSHAYPSDPQCLHRTAPATLSSSAFTHSQAVWRPWS